MSLLRRSNPIERAARTELKRALRVGAASAAKPLLLFGQGMPVDMYLRFAKQRRRVLQAHGVTLADPSGADAMVVIWGLDPAERPTTAHPTFKTINGVVAARMGPDSDSHEAFAAGIPQFMRTYSSQGPYRLSTPTLEIYDRRGGREQIPMSFGLTFPEP